MKYVLLTYQPSSFDPKALSPEEYQVIAAQYAEISANPKVTPGLPLGKNEKAMTVRVIDGEVKVTAGPYVSAAGAVGGYFVLDAETKEEAIALAAKIPAARLGGAIEIRPAEVYW
jgi:hypothetical protein